MDTNTVKLFDANNNLVPNFDSEIEKILISIHGENYYDVDEDLENTNHINFNTSEDIYRDSELDKTIEMVNAMVTENSPSINIVEKKDKKVSFKDFIPVIFFIIIFVIIVVSGYYFLNTVDLLKLIK